MNNWIRTSEKLPDDRELYLVVVREKYSYENFYRYNIDCAYSNGEYIDNFWDTMNDWDEGQEVTITHWMPLPKLPKDII